MLLSIWALICVSVCLPLITLKLYARNIRELFQASTRRYSWREKAQKYRPNETDEQFSDKAPTGEELAKLKPWEIYSTNPNSEKSKKDDSRFRPKQ